MKAIRYIMILFGVLGAFLCSSCGSLPKDESDNALGPLTDEDPKAWNRRESWEGQSALGGFSQ